MCFDCSFVCFKWMSKDESSWTKQGKIYISFFVTHVDQSFLNHLKHTIVIFFSDPFLSYIQIGSYLCSSGDSSDKELACQCRRNKRYGFKHWVRKILWMRAWQSIPVFLPGESHGQRSPVGYSQWSHKEVDIDWSYLAHRHTQLVIYSYLWHLCHHQKKWGVLTSGNYVWS